MKALSWLLILGVVACDVTSISPASLTVPSTSIPKDCRGDGKRACPPDVTPTEPETSSSMDSIWVHPLHAQIEVGQSMPYWMIGWFDDQPWACADDGTQFIGRVLVNDNGLRGMREQVYTPSTIIPPEIRDYETVIPDLSVCEIHVEPEDPLVVEWQPFSFLSTVSAWLRGMRA